ncbi:uncharacterized protein MONOS_13473 [Monocercomonoides exilis]|uniref:uncharacterized protein n=1 Tax=Monocercomonoides exilis TaxID=2049356 RepID=UPI0035593B67|nr:hypothetical protein MONOS_13473 [Monocercomonoides exilis]|eukprot:MONOS_13473.1-p1 / transcript=MONOS_13473.1 / gene=MONOS_13473 / organism=Monocercomonoides_exilis_PA203 / gene_product=unspecified product / transcript_product=unspecified product / location=Mono_scaffold00834:2085-3615(+) / protein_length=444 / sequence_SO=supercontig / SO=protein_coding / is_pseudo=false
MIKGFGANNKSADELKKITSNEHFLEFLRELGRCDENAQRQKIEEMNEIIEEMEEEEFKSVFTKKWFDEMDELIKEEKLSMRNVIFLLKQIGHCYELKNMWNRCFEKSLLYQRFEKMIINENEKIEDKDERLLVDLCECYASLRSYFPKELISIIVPCLLKVALRKEESKEVQNEVEMTLLALCHIEKCVEMNKELHMNEIKEIIKYHQEHHNLTQLAYQYAWEFLINRLFCDTSLEDVVVNELHFAREAARELEELTRCVDWKRKKEERRKETKEELAMTRWLNLLYRNFCYRPLMNKEYSGIIRSIALLFRASRDNYSKFGYSCIVIFEAMANSRGVKIEDMLKGGAIDAFLEEMHRPTLNDKMVYNCLEFFMNVSQRLKEKKKDEMEEAKRKAFKKEISEKMEEVGSEEIIASFHKRLDFLNRNFCHGLLLNISDYFVNV